MTPCTFCGDPDHQHRVRDAIVGRFTAGESIQSLARDYGETVGAIEATLRQAFMQRKPLLGRDQTTKQTIIPSRWSEKDWHDPEYRHAYAEGFLFSRLATQLVVLRKQRGWTQEQLAERAGMAQARVSVIEDVNYQRWTIRTLLRLAEAFDCWLQVSFESYDTFADELDQFRREGLQR